MNMHEPNYLIFLPSEAIKKSPAKLRIVLVASVSGGGYNTLLMCITH